MKWRLKDKYKDLVNHVGKAQSPLRDKKGASH